jgi:hypothetical protein
MSRSTISFLALLLYLPAAWAESYEVPPEFWLNARTGTTVLAQPAIAHAAQRFNGHAGSVLVIYHTRQDESVAEAEELRGWLIALGLDAGRVRLAEDPATGRTLKLEVTETK